MARPFRLGRPLCLALILVASILSHLKGITAPLLDYHSHRQCNTAIIARNYHRNGLRFLTPQIDWEGANRGRAATEFPLYMWLIGLLWPLGGLGELWGRILSVLFSALTGVYLFKFLEGQMEGEAAFYAAILFSCLPLEIYFGRTVQPEALALLGTIASFFHWDRFLAVVGGSPPRSLQGLERSWLAHKGNWLAAVLMAFLAIAHKLPYAYIFIPLGCLAWLRLGPAALKKPGVWLAFLLAAVGVGAWYRFASSGIYVVPTHVAEFLGQLQYRRLPYFTQFQFLSRFPELAATYAGVFLIAFGAKELIVRRGLAFFAVWFGSIALHLIAGGGYAFSHEYTSLPFALVNAALMGMGLYQLKSKIPACHSRLKPWAWGGLAVLALSVPVHAHLRINHWYAMGEPFWANAREAADRISSPEDLFLCNDRGTAALFYLDRKGWPVYLPDGDKQSRLRLIEERILLGARFFVTPKESLLREEFFANYFYSRYPVVYDQDGLLGFRLR